MWPTLTIALALVACGGSARPTPVPVVAPKPKPPIVQEPPAPEAMIVGVVLAVSPGEAEVSIDDVERGPASKLQRAIALEPGLHQLIVTLEGYKPYRAEFTVSDKTEKFTVHLERAR